MAKKKKHRKHITERQRIRRKLRSGSREVKRILLAENPHCDICGRTGISLELHHVKMIRWGYATDINYCRLLCHDCHRRYHEYDRYLNMLHSQGNMDFIGVYERIKKQIQTRYILP